MIRLPPRSIRTYTLFPYTTPVRAIVKSAEPDGGPGAGAADELAALLDRADRFSFVGNGRAGKNRQAKGCADCMLDRHHRQFPSCFPVRRRSEEHTSELQSLMRSSYAVFCLKKKKIHHTQQ